MALTQSTTARVALVVLVTRDAAGDLRTGAEHRLGRVDGVRSVDDLRVTGVTPTLSDLRVACEVTVHVDGPSDSERIARRLDAGFGVRAVEVRAVG